MTRRPPPRLNFLPLSACPLLGDVAPQLCQQLHDVASELLPWLELLDGDVEDDHDGVVVGGVKCGKCGVCGLAPV